MALTYTVLVPYLYPEVFHLQIPLPQLPLLFTSRNTQYSRYLCHRIPFFALVLFHRPEWRSCVYFFYFGMGLMASTIISRRLLIVSARQPWSTYMRLITAPDIQYPKTMDVQAWCYLHVTVLSTLIEHFFNINSDSFYNHRSHLLSTSALHPTSTRLSQSMLVMCSLEQLLAGKFRRVVCITGTSRDNVESCGQDRKGAFGECNPTNSHHRCNNNTLVRCTSDGKWARAPR